MNDSAQERGLLVGILVDAIEAVLRAGEGPHEARRARDARAWMEAEEPDWPFSLLTVCQTLEVDRVALRAALFAPGDPVAVDHLPTDDAD